MPGGELQCSELLTCCGNQNIRLPAPPQRIKLVCAADWRRFGTIRSLVCCCSACGEECWIRHVQLLQSGAAAVRIQEQQLLSCCVSRWQQSTSSWVSMIGRRSEADGSRLDMAGSSLLSARGRSWPRPCSLRQSWDIHPGTTHVRAIGGICGGSDNPEATRHYLSRRFVRGCFTGSVVFNCTGAAVQVYMSRAPRSRCATCRQLSM